MQYPIILNLERLSVVIIGGGSIAFRKCKYFLEINKYVTVIAKEVIPQFINSKNYINLILDSYKEEYIRQANLVIIATDDKKLNREIALTSLKQGKLVNVADDKNLSNFHIPAAVKRGDLLLTVSTSGKSPALAKQIKEELSIIYDETYETYVNLLGKARIQILSNNSDPKIKKEKLNQLLALNLEELIKIYG